MLFINMMLPVVSSLDYRKKLERLVKLWQLSRNDVIVISASNNLNDGYLINLSLAQLFEIGS